MTTHTIVQTPAVGNPLEGHKDIPPPPTHSHHQTESCPLTLIWPFSCSLDPHCYRGTGHSFLFFGGFGGQLHLTKSSVANSLQQDQLVEVVLGAE